MTDTTTETERKTAEPEPVSPKTTTRLSWRGDIPAQKWVNFYMKVLTRFVSHHHLKLTLQVEVSGGEGILPQKVEEMKAALRELGLEDVVTVG